jgi:hypothetical protein
MGLFTKYLRTMETSARWVKNVNVPSMKSRQKKQENDTMINAEPLEPPSQCGDRGRD